mgnify:CR=1 FL=1
MIEIREGTRQDIQRVLTFLAQVRAEMPHPEWFCLDTPEEFRERMENGGMRLWVAEDAKRLAGVFTVVYPGISPIQLRLEAEPSPGRPCAGSEHGYGGSPLGLSGPGLAAQAHGDSGKRTGAGKNSLMHHPSG